MSAFTDKLIAAAKDEWEFFNFSRRNLDGTTELGRKEYEDGVYMRVNEYWKVVHDTYKPKYGHLTGKDRGWAWSAAFICFCMQEAQATTSEFDYSSWHGRYINTAIRAADNNDTQAIYRAHKKGDYTLKQGDMVAYWRGPQRITMENARRIGWYQSHCDIVTEVGDKFVKVIGGNVYHSVTEKALRTNDKGELTDTSEKWFTVLECQK